jgi:hypothetical protein
VQSLGSEPNEPVESDPSGSDFEADRNNKMRQREFRLSRGKEVSDTEAEELEDEEELEGEVVSDEGVKRCQRNSPPRLTTKQKGKGREIAEEVDGQGENGAEESGYAHGPMSKQAVEEAVELGKATRESAEAIAKKYGKPVRSVMIAAGLGIQNARATNFSNLHKVWYAHHYPKPKNSTVLSLFALNLTDI